VSDRRELQVALAMAWPRPVELYFTAVQSICKVEDKAGKMGLEVNKRKKDNIMSTSESRRKPQDFLKFFLLLKCQVTIYLTL
jgi:hypothetical protein